MSKVLRYAHLGVHPRALMSTTPAVQATASMTKRVDAVALNKLYNEGSPIVVLTAYDHPTAQAMNDAADVILVGDSVGMVVHGYPNTISVTTDAMLLHCAAVSRGAPRPFLVGDLPFGSYATVDDAARTAVRFVQEGYVQAVKLEGGRSQAAKVSAIVGEGIPVMGHVGLLPQTAPLRSGFTLQGRTADDALKVVEDALKVADAGAVSLVLEMVPAQVAAFITALLTIPTIGIGSGQACSGQVLVAHDILGMFPGRKPSFVKQYANVGRTMNEAFSAYAADVKAGRFPGPDRTGCGARGAARDASGTLFEQQAAKDSTQPPQAAAAAPSKSGTSARPARFHRDMDPVEFSRFAEAAHRAYGSNAKAMAALEASARDLQATAAASAAAVVPASSASAAPGSAPTPAASSEAAATAGADGQAKPQAGFRPLFNTGMEPSISVAVVGTGALGSLLASQLALNPALSCVDVYGQRRARVEAINSTGLNWRPHGANAEEVIAPASVRSGSGLPLLRAFCLEDTPGYGAVLRYLRDAGAVPGHGAAAPVSSTTDAGLSNRRYDIVFLAGKALDVPEQSVAASLLVRTMHDMERAGSGALSSPFAYPGASALDGAAPIKGRPGVIIPLYNGAYSLEYCLGLMSRLRLLAGLKPAEEAAPGAAPAAVASGAEATEGNDAEPAGTSATPVAPANSPALPILASVLGPAVAAHLASLRPVGQVGYGVTSMGAALGPTPDAAVACTGHGPTYVCAEPLYAVDPSSQADLLLPPELALKHSAAVSQALGTAQEASARSGPLQASLVPQNLWNAHRWGKIAVNSVLNPTVALLGTTNGGFVQASKAARKAVQAAAVASGSESAKSAGLVAMANEACSAALLKAGTTAAATADTPATGRSLPLPAWQGVRSGSALLDVVEKAASATSDNINSMWSDGLSGRPSEVDFICGAVVEAVEDAGKTAPGQRAAQAAVHAKERALGVRDASDPADPITARMEHIISVAKQASGELMR